MAFEDPKKPPIKLLDQLITVESMADTVTLHLAVHRTPLGSFKAH
jgi:hypothetical protein